MNTEFAHSNQKSNKNTEINKIGMKKLKFIIPYIETLIFHNQPLILDLKGKVTNKLIFHNEKKKVLKLEIKQLRNTLESQLPKNKILKTWNNFEKSIVSS